MISKLFSFDGHHEQNKRIQFIKIYIFTVNLSPSFPQNQFVIAYQAYKSDVAEFIAQK